MAWRVWACPGGMRGPGVDREEELSGQPANPGSPGKKWPLKRSVCVCACDVM